MYQAFVHTKGGPEWETIRVCHSNMVVTAPGRVIPIWLYFTVLMNRLTYACIRQIPFKDFLLTNQGYVQNEQLALNRGRIRAVGLLLADRLNVCA